MKSECIKLGDSNNVLLKVQFSAKIELWPAERILAIAPNGGSIATCSEDRVYLKVPDRTTHLKGFLPTGSVDDSIVAAWFDGEEERLCLLFADGRLFRIISDTQWEEEQLLSSMDSEAETLAIVEAKPSLSKQGSIIIALDSLNRFIVFNDKHLQLHYLSCPPCLQFNSPQCWCPVTVTVGTQRHHPQAVLFAVENKLSLATANGVIERSCAPYGTICQLAVNSVGNKAAVLTADRRCLVFDVPELQLIVDISVVQFPVLHVDTMKLAFDDGILVAASRTGGKRLVLLDLETGEELSVSFDDAVLAAIEEECDGVRVNTRTGDTWMIVRMPQIMQNPPDFSQPPPQTQTIQERVRTVESASAHLLDLSFESGLQEQIGSECAQVMLKELKPQLNEETFAYIWAMLRKQLDACKLFSALQLHFPITPQQFTHAGRKQILKRLCQRDLHFEAFQLALGMEWDMSSLLTDWTIKVMKQSAGIESERVLADKVMDKLMTWSPHRAAHVNFLRLAEEAIRLQLPVLASKLLQHCPTSREKIELLVKVDAYEDALKASIADGHAEEIKFVLDCLLERLTLTAFLQLAQISDRVKAALFDYCRVNQPVLLQILLYQDDRLDELLVCRLGSGEDRVLELGKWFKMLRVQRCFEKRTGGSVKLLGLSERECMEKLKPYKLSLDFQESIK